MHTPTAERRKAERRQGRLRLMPAVPSPLDQGDESPFLRPNRRLRARRARRGWLGRTVLVIQVGGGLLGGAWVMGNAYASVMASERLKVGRVEVRGSRFLSEGEVRELIGPAVGENILALDIDGLTSRLRASPWVAHAMVARTLPDTLRVEIQERVPLALAEVERLYLMDGEGTLIDIYGPRTAGFDLPIVRGLRGIGGAARRERAERAGALLHDLGELAAEVSEVAVDRSGDLRVVLRGPGEVLRMGAPPYRKKLVRFLALRKELAERCPGAQSFDLRFRDRIYVEGPPPASAAEGPSEAPPAPTPEAQASPAPAEPPAAPRGRTGPRQDQETVTGWDTAIGSGLTAVRRWSGGVRTSLPPSWDSLPARRN